MTLLDLIRFKPKPPPPHRLSAKDLDFAFRDNDGKSYYRFTTQIGIGLEHYGKAMEFTQFMSAGLTASELHALIDIQEKTIENLVEKKQGALANLMYICREIKLRSQIVMHTELLYNFVACHYIREDESPNEWIEQIHNEKVEAFKQIVGKGSSFDFFHLPELRNITAIFTMSQDEWDKQWSDSIREQINLRKKIDYLKSELDSAKPMKTARKAL